MPATDSTVHDTVLRSHKAFQNYRKLSPRNKKEFLYAIADELYALGDVLIQTASAESHLPEARFIGERERTCRHFRLFGDHVAEGSWVEAVLDMAEEDRKPVRKPDMRTMLRPIGPIVVFGASNFPLAYSAPGGDTASALAAGCTVIVKGHPAHPKTSEWVTKAIHKACDTCGISRDVFQLIQSDSYDLAKALVLHPQVAGVGFTGSLSGGRAIYEYVRERKVPIPVFAEMGSTNPVCLMPEKLRTEGNETARILSKSMTLGVGQFCTNPGILLGLRSDDLNTFINHLTEYLTSVPAYKMLNEGIFQHFKRGLTNVTDSDGILYLIPFKEYGDIKTSAVLATVSSEVFLKNPNLKDEVFGPFSLIIQCESTEDMKRVWASFPGQLTTTFMAAGSDYEIVKDMLSTAECMAGRIVFNGEPTGVEVGFATVHGGPYPATTDSRFTSVGMDAIKRWARPVCYQDCPEDFLPEELKNTNPSGIWRKVNGQFCR